MRWLPFLRFCNRRSLPLLPVPTDELLPTFAQNAWHLSYGLVPLSTTLDKTSGGGGGGAFVALYGNLIELVNGFVGNVVHGEAVYWEEGWQWSCCWWITPLR